MKKCIVCGKEKPFNQFYKQHKSKDGLFNRCCVCVKEYQRQLRNEQRFVEEKYIYVISNPAWGGWLKIGLSKDPKKRIQSYQVYSPLRDYRLEFMFKTFYGHRIEMKLKDKIEIRGEWFNVSIDDVKKMIFKINSQIKKQ
jgi:hypothetical protein